MIELNHLSKRFGEQVIFSDVSERFESGKIHGIVGRNGSGKTVLLRMLIGLYYPDQGSVIIDGMRVGKDTEFAPRTGFLIETPRFLSQFSGIENLTFLTRLTRKVGVEQARVAMESVGLDPSLKKAVGKYSLGMRQKLGIAQALMEKPDLIILDEPMNALDKASVLTIRKLLLTARDAGKTIFLATHQQSDIETLCDDLYEVCDGKLIAHTEKGVCHA